MKFRNQGCQSSYAEVELGFHEKDGFIEAEECWGGWTSSTEQPINLCFLVKVQKKDTEELLTATWTDTGICG